MDRMFVKYHRAAKEADALIVPACGFDCIPNDVGVEFTRQQFPDPSLVSVRLREAAVPDEERARSNASVARARVAACPPQSIESFFTMCADVCTFTALGCRAPY